MDDNEIDFGPDDDMSNDEQVFYNKEFVNKFFTLKNWTEAADWIVAWFKVQKHNPTDYASDFPILLEHGCEYRQELIKKHQNPENFPRDLIMA